MDFLRKDLEHLFDAQGVDRSAYADKVAFRVGHRHPQRRMRQAGNTHNKCMQAHGACLCPEQDPLSSYNTLSGYLFNIQFLRRAFGPRFILHDLRQTGNHEITSRWTMLMSLQVNAVQSTALSSASFS